MRIDDLVQSCGDSLFAPESLDDIRRRLAFIESSECECDTTPHEDAIHDLAHDDVPVLLRVIEKLLTLVDDKIPVVSESDQSKWPNQPA